MRECDADTALGELAEVVWLHRVRTLVVARDLAFRRRAMTVLGDLGVASFAIAGADARGELLALVAQERPHVVVLDATGCAPATVAFAHELCERSPRVGVVLVSADGDERGLGLPVLPKWGWADDLTRAVRAAYHCGNPFQEEPMPHAQ
jgi:hypothetical protein